MTLRAVLFDYGHTLIDFARPEAELLDAYHRVNLRLERELECEVPAAADLLRDVSQKVDGFIGESYRSGSEQEVNIAQLYNEALAALGLELPGETVQWVVDEEQYAWFNGLLKSPHADTVLDELKGHGLAVGIVSNAAFPAHTMRWQMEQLGLLDRFDATVFSSELGLRKPNQAIYAAALRQLDVAAGDTLFIGDRLREDVLGPRAIGVDAVLTHEFRQEDPGEVAVEVVSDLTGLLEVVDRRLAA